VNGWRLLAENPGVLDRLDPTSVADEVRRTSTSRTNLPPEFAAILTRHPGTPRRGRRRRRDR
jgi:hypothetical protein